MQHIPVLTSELIHHLQVRPGANLVDGTLGGGGHTEAILEASAPDGLVLGLDADPEAIERVSDRLADAADQGRLQIVQANFDQIATVVHQHRFTPVNGILLDLGVSSFQLDTADRGFSFSYDGPLDMRFDPNQPMTAADIVNRWSEQELANLLYHYGNERQSRRIAKVLVRNRPITTTRQLAETVISAVGRPPQARIHPATRTFQALRIAVNRELERLEAVLPQCLSLLQPGGRLAVISFHSLEDRIVKRWMQDESSDFVQDPTHPFGGYERTPTLRMVTKKPVAPSKQEIDANPRSRSAKLRIAERI